MHDLKRSFFIATIILCHALSVMACSSDDQSQPEPDAGASSPDAVEEDISRPDADSESDATSDTENDTEPVEELRLEITPESAEINIGEALQLALEVSGTAGEGSAPDEGVTWTSSAPEIAAIDAEGLVTGLAAGVVVVEAKFGDLSAQAEVRVEIKFVHLHCEPGAVCIAISEDGELYTMGTAGTYPSDDGLMAPRFEKVEVEGDLRFKSAVIHKYTGFAYCAISTDDRLYCWGDNTYARLGKPIEVPKIQQPTALDTDLRFMAVEIGEFMSCGLSLEGELYCWGDRNFGLMPGKPNELDTISTEPFLMGEGPFSGLLGNGRTICVQGAYDNRTSCVGYGWAGLIGNRMTRHQFSLTEVAYPGYFSALAGTYVGDNSGVICGLDREQMVWCWGMNSNGEFGQVLTPYIYSAPQRTAWGMAFINLSHVERGFCGETFEHEIRCWGDNRGCSLGREASGNGDEPDVHPMPDSAVEGLPDDWTLNSSNCVLSESGGVWCWGLNREAGETDEPSGCDPVARRVASSHP